MLGDSSAGWASVKALALLAGAAALIELKKMHRRIPAAAQSSRSCCVPRTFTSSNDSSAAGSGRSIWCTVARCKTQAVEAVAGKMTGRLARHICHVKPGGTTSGTRRHSKVPPMPMVANRATRCRPTKPLAPVMRKSLKSSRRWRTLVDNAPWPEGDHSAHQRRGGHSHRTWLTAPDDWQRR